MHLDDYMQTTTVVLTPLPVSRTEIDENCEDREGAAKTDLSHSSKLRIEQGFEAEILSTSKPDYPGGQAKILTLVI